jgi:hypothetical protein
MLCPHHKTISDTYGVSCQACGGVLEGYGYGGWFGSTVTGNTP